MNKITPVPKVIVHSSFQLLAGFGVGDGDAKENDRRDYHSKIEHSFLTPNV